MQFHILDENYTPVTVMDNDLPDTIHFQKSKFHRFLTGSADFFDFETSKLHVDHNKLQVGYWIAFKYDDRDRLQYINEIAEAESDKMMSISTLSNNLDLNQENTQPFSADIARPFSWYFDKIMYDTGYEIGINEISNLTRKLSWDSEMSHRAFLQSVATQFDNAELDYEVILNSDFTIKKRLVHIKKQVGEVRDDIELRYEKNIKTVKRSTNINNLYTAIKPISKDDNGKVTDISSMPDWQKLDENGNVKFFHKKGSQHILAPRANARFGNRSTGGYVVYDYSYDKVSQSDLFNRSVTKLEEISVPAINYDVEGRTGAKIGDTVKIVDDGYTPPLILSARVLEQEFSFDDASVEQGTFGNYKALQSQISDDLIAKMQQLAEENAPYKAQTLTTNGLTFKNSEGSTTLTAILYKGSKEIVPESYAWTINGIAISENSEQYEITADDIYGKAVVRWSAVINGVTVAFDEVIITDVSDGTDGISPTVKINPDTSLTIVDAKGTRKTPVLKGSDGLAGKDGVGIKKTTITYASHTNGTTAPATGYTTTVPSVPSGQFLWTKTIWTYTDNTSETGYSVAMMGLKGDKGDPGIKGSDGTSGIIVSSVAPASPQNGQLWQDTSTTPQLVKKWTGSSWVIWELYAQNLKSDSLESLSAIIGKLSNTYSADYGAGVHTGTVTIENGMKIVDDSGISRTITDFTSQSSGQGMFARYLPDKYDTAKYQQAWYTPFSLRFDDTVNDWHGQITAENVTLVPWTNLTYLSGFTTAENNPCQYRKIKNLDGSYTVQFKGQVKPVSGRFNATGEYLPLQVPAVIKPSINAFGIGIPDFTNIQSARIVVLRSDGRVQFMIRGNATDYVSLDMMSYTL